MNPRETSRQLFEKALRYIPGGVNSPVRAFRNVGGTPFFTKKAEGCRLWDADDNCYIDYVGTWGPAILGHAPACVIDAITATAKNGTSFGTPNPLEPEMAELICQWVPSVDKVRMVNSGTEAVLSAVRLARGYTNRRFILKFEGCYHGHVDALLVSAGSGALTHGQPDSAGVPAEYAALTLTAPFNDIERVEALFAAHGDDIAAVILEPYPGNAGFYLPKPGFLESLRSLTTRYGAVLIFDEVMTGFRVARGGVQELTGVTPDITTLGKIIGGGLPVGAFGGKAEIMDQLAPNGPVYQAGTLSGNPLALAAGLAQLREMDRIGAWSQLEKAGQQLESGIHEILSRHGLNYQFLRSGSMFCLFFTGKPVFNLDDAKTSDKEGFRKFFHECLDHGVFVAPSPFEAGFLSTAHTETDIGTTLEVIEAALKKSREP
jgi:glutamate-1-semialdehyde 2,1-aminomutase